MKVTFTILYICCNVGISWCQSDSTELGIPKLFHLSTNGNVDSVFLHNTFTVLSLVSPDMFDKWNADSLKLKYAKKSVLIIVARQDNNTKKKFVTKFYQAWIATGSKQKAYEQATQEIGTNSEIKHILMLNDQ